jgi:hypothetical protein
LGISAPPLALESASRKHRQRIDWLATLFDACADANVGGSVWFRVSDTALLVANEGVPFDEPSIRAIRALARIPVTATELMLLRFIQGIRNCNVRKTQERRAECPGQPPPRSAKTGGDEAEQLPGIIDRKDSRCDWADHQNQR